MATRGKPNACSFEGAVKSAAEANSFAACKWRFIRAILLDGRLTDRSKVVGIYVAERYIHKRGNVAHPGRERLATELGKSVRTIERAMFHLVRCGYLIQGRASGGRGRGQAHSSSSSARRGASIG